MRTLRLATVHHSKLWLRTLSTINRVGRTVAQDGVNFDANDRFALDTARRDSAFSLREAKPQSLSVAKDNQRLIAISGADGADGAWSFGHLPLARAKPLFDSPLPPT